MVYWYRKKEKDRRRAPGKEHRMGYTERMLNAKDGAGLTLRVYEAEKAKAAVMCIHGMEEHQGHYQRQETAREPRHEIQHRDTGILEPHG